MAPSNQKSAAVFLLLAVACAQAATVLKPSIVTATTIQPPTEVQPKQVEEEEAATTTAAALEETPPPLEPPSLQRMHSTREKQEELLRFTKTMYSALSGRNLPELAAEFRDQYNRLQEEDTEVATMLNSLSDMRLHDLQISVRHAKRMQELLLLLSTSV